MARLTTARYKFQRCLYGVELVVKVGGQQIVFPAVPPHATHRALIAVRDLIAAAAFDGEAWQLLLEGFDDDL